MSVLGFSRDPGPLPFATVRDRDKWLPRLANGQIEIRSEGQFPMEQRMVRVAGVMPIERWQAEGAGYYVPDVYRGKPLILVYLEPL